MPTRAAPTRRHRLGAIALAAALALPLHRSWSDPPADPVDRSKGGICTVEFDQRLPEPDARPAPPTMSPVLGELGLYQASFDPPLGHAGPSGILPREGQ